MAPGDQESAQQRVGRRTARRVPGGMEGVKQPGGSRMVKSSHEGFKQLEGRRVAKRRRVVRESSDSEEDVEFPKGTEWPRGCRVALGR